jgi:tetratricopeptide (TPR) repeat protein
MYSLVRWIAGLAGKKLSHGHQPIDAMEELIEENEDLRCFNALLQYLKAAQHSRIDYREAARIMEQAYETALEIDDLVIATQALNAMGVHLRNFNRSRALEVAHKAENLAKQLGLGSAEMSSLYVRRGVHSARGEFSASVDCNYDMLELRERSRETSLHVDPHSMAFLYNEMGESEDALEWSRVALESYRTAMWAAPYPYFDMARSLIGLGRLDEGREYLEEGKKKAIKLGDELFLQVAYFNEGLLEMAENRLDDAMLSFEKALDICERTERRSRMNSTLIAMVECEILLFQPTRNNQNDEYSGKWMERLEKDVEQEDIPGIHGRLLLLKAKLRLIQERRKDAEQLLTEVRRLAENPYVRYLIDRVTELREQARLLET